jgi:two-component system nitrate/nitrite response regulator NarL
VPVVICSGDVDPDTKRSALQAGTSGFLPKTMRSTTMLRALQLILSGKRYIPKAAVAEARVVARRVSVAEPPQEGSLRLLVEGLSNKQIGQRLEIEVVTAAVHLRSIYRKLTSRAARRRSAGRSNRAGRIRPPEAANAEPPRMIES